MLQLQYLVGLIKQQMSEQNIDYENENENG